VGTTPLQLAMGDFNGDKKLDLAVVNSGSGSVSILLGNGDGTFTAGATVNGLRIPSTIVAADFNNDGFMDLVVTNQGTNSASILTGNGTGGFAVSGSFAVGTRPVAAVVGDFNNDGLPDVAVVNSGSNYVSVLTNVSVGGVASFLTTDFGIGSGPVFDAPGDFNQDGKVDLAIAQSNPVSNNVLVLLNNTK